MGCGLLASCSRHCSKSRQDETMGCQILGAAVSKSKRVEAYSESFRLRSIATTKPVLSAPELADDCAEGKQRAIDVAPFFEAGALRQCL